MVTKAGTNGNPEESDFVNQFKELYDELTKQYAPAFICKNKGDYFIGVFTGEMSMVPSEYGEVLVLEFEFQEGAGQNKDGDPFSPDRGETVTYWFMGDIQHDAVLEYRPTPGEAVGIYNHGKRWNKPKTFEYNDMRVLMPNREQVTRARKVRSWDDVKPKGVAAEQEPKED